MKYNPRLDGVIGMAILLVIFAHFPFDFLITSFTTKVIAIDLVLSLIIYIVFITVLAWFSFNYYEKYFLKLKRFFK